MPPLLVPGADLDLVIPALNEEERIEATVAGVCAWAQASSRRVHLIVVDNGSADATTESIDRALDGRLSAEIVGCRIRGKGAAVRAGIARSHAPLVGYFDADLATPLSSLGPGLQLLEEGWDVVLASRLCAGASYVVPQPILRRSGSWCFRWVARRYVGPVSDTQCGFKLFGGPAARAIFSTTSMTGFAFDVEVIAHAQSRGLRIVEMPVTWSDKDGSTFRPFRDGLSSFRDLAGLRRSLAAAA